MLSDFMNRQNNPIMIMITCRKLLHDLRTWGGDFDCHGMEIATNWPGEVINTEEDAFAAIKLARYRAKYRKSLKEKTESIGEPGKFDNIDYAKWCKALMNQLTSILGANDVPLMYVVCPDEKKDEGELEGK